MTTRTVTIEIRVHPIVQKYLQFHYDTEPFALSNSPSANVFSSYLYACLERYGHYDTRLPKKYDKLTGTMQVGVAGWVKQSGHGIKITPAKVSSFNNFVRRSFYENMTTDVTIRMAYGMGLVAATRRYLDRYGMTDDEISLETALRYYARYRQRMLIDDCHTR